MKLRNRTLIYGIFLGLSVIVLLMSYMFFLLPPLYVAEKEEQNRTAAIEFHRNVLSTEGDSASSNPGVGAIGQAFWLVTDKDSDMIRVGTMFGNGQITIKDERVLALYRQMYGLMDSMKLRDSFSSEGEGGSRFLDSQKLKAEFEECAVNFGKIMQEYSSSMAERAPFLITFESNTDGDLFSASESSFEVIGRNTLFLELKTSDKRTADYLVYVAVSRIGERFYITVVSAITPRVNDIQPVITGSLPMILLSVLALVLISSFIYSGLLIRPIERIHRFTSDARMHGAPVPMNMRGGDELSQLARDVESMHKNLVKQYERLEAESRGREVFLRASSHRLKTPLAAALLLVDGMQNNIGKYADRDEYLPVLREQLTDVRRMIERILFINRRSYEQNIVKMQLRPAIENILEKMKIQIMDRGLLCRVEGDGEIMADDELMIHILDNLIQNALQYTGEGGLIAVEIRDGGFLMKNSPASIEPTLLASVKEPFVSGAESKGSGLGLYIADYFARLMGLTLEIESSNNEVEISVKKYQKYKE